MSSPDEIACSPASPSTPPQSFQYDALTDSENEIRLLRILPHPHHSDQLQAWTSRDLASVHCEMFHTTLKRALAYKALSYAWGPADGDRHSIRLNGRHFFVRENLWLALQQLHTQPTPVVIWIDAMCINQKDDMERNEQVAKMKTIYEKAEEVVVWLGPAKDDSHLAFQFMQDMYDHRNDIEWIVQKLEHPEFKRSVVSLYELFQRNYWWRMWITQELVVAKGICLRCGPDSIGATALDETQKILQAMRLGLRGFQEDHLSILFQNSWTLIGGVQYAGISSIRDFQKNFQSNNLSLYQCLLLNKFKECSDPRDMVYGLAALANSKSTHPTKIDYSLPIAEVYTDFVRMEIQNSQQLQILTRARSGSNFPGLPSWVVDWSRNRDRHYFLSSNNSSECRYYAAGESKCDVFPSHNMHHLVLRGVVVGKVKQLGDYPTSESENDIKNAGRTFLKWWATLSVTGDRGEQRQLEFSRTLICDQFHQITKEEVEFSVAGGFYQSILTAYYSICMEIGLTTVPDPLLVEENLVSVDKEKEYAAGVDSTLNQQQRTKNHEAWIQTSIQFIWDRRFFLGSSGLMGLATEGVAEGDTICVPLGCPHPMIFRKVQDHYIVIGEAYVDGYMYGKAMDMLEKGELELETFELH